MVDARVEDVMTHLVVMLYPSDTIHDAAARLARNAISGAPVVDSGKVVGVASESDLIRAVMPSAPIEGGHSILDLVSRLGRALGPPHHHGKTVAEVMSPRVFRVSPKTGIWHAAAIMERKGVKRLPVVADDGYLLGIISRADIVKAIGRVDSRISADTIEAIRLICDETIEGLGVEVVEGIATVKGRADRRSTHEIALRIAQRTPGVVEVVDRMTHGVDRHPHRPDRDSVDHRFDWNPVAAVNRRSE
jgi:CBS domain-containing protein